MREKPFWILVMSWGICFALMLIAVIFFPESEVVKDVVEAIWSR